MNEHPGYLHSDQIRSITRQFAPPEPEATGFAYGTPAFRKVSLAIFLAGFAAFSLLYSVQPLLLAFSHDYGVTPATSALSLSLATGALAFAILASSVVGRGLPRRPLMFFSIIVAAVLNLATSAAPDWSMLLLARLLEGFVLGGVPAIAMTYLADAIRPQDLGKAMGFYVSGTASGGMVGRVGMGILAEFGSWRMAMAVLGVLGVMAAVGFAMLLPTSHRSDNENRAPLAHHLKLWSQLARQSDLRKLFGVGFLVMSVFVTTFNYAGFRLSIAPFNLSQTSISCLFLTYLAGIVVSPLGGYIADRFGGRLPLAASFGIILLGLTATIPNWLPSVGLGILLITIGFFAAHSIASAWVGRLSGNDKSHASSLYLLAYYLGSGVTGFVGGWFWQHMGWLGVVGLTGLIAAIGGGLAFSIRNVEMFKDHSNKPSARGENA